MRAYVLSAVAALLLVAPATQAAAKSVKIDAVGTVEFGTDDVGAFGGGNLAGAAWSYTATFDLTHAGYLASGGFRTDIFGGEVYSYLPGGAPPSLGNAVFSMKGVDRLIEANWNTTLVAYNDGVSNFDQQYVMSRRQVGADFFAESVLLVETPGHGFFDLANYQPPAGNLCGAGYTCNTGNFVLTKYTNGQFAANTFAQLNATSVTLTLVADPPPPPPPPPTAVPEPATWALLIGGFSLAGGALRRRRAESATA